MVESNRFQWVPRERLHGLIDGVDFGSGLSCLARSPAKALLWSGGTSYTSGRGTQYGTSTLYTYDRQGNAICNGRRIGDDGGRLSVARVQSVAAEINALFEDDFMEQISEAVAKRQTLLIEGGGEPFRPKA